MEDVRGLALTTSEPRAADLYNDAAALLFEYRLRTMPIVKEALAADPDFVMGHCLQGYLFMMFGTFSVLDAARGALAKAEAGLARASERERAHVTALRAWSEGDVAAAGAAWDRILFEHPRDLLALRLQHFNSFWMGRTVALRNTPASVLHAWDESVPGYGNVLGMLAFGYEECGEYARAEDAGRRGVALNPDDLWALHAVAHVMEMQGRHAEGIAWLSRPADAWADRNPFRGHLWWHLALQHLDAGDTDAPLALYDRSIYNANSNFYLDIQNAASLLARLEFCGVEVGARWAPLADHAETHLDDHALAFTDLHCMMSLARAGRFAAARQLLDSMTRYAEDPRAYAAAAMRAAALPLCRAILAFGEQRYEDAVALFLPLRHSNQIVGASHAQREIFALYLIVAAVRSGDRGMADALLRERAALKPGSAITDRLVRAAAAR